jgi:hypothetical protein
MVGVLFILAQTKLEWGAAGGLTHKVEWQVTYLSTSSIVVVVREQSVQKPEIVFTSRAPSPTPMARTSLKGRLACRRIIMIVGSGSPPLSRARFPMAAEVARRVVSVHHRAPLRWVRMLPRQLGGC